MRSFIFLIFIIVSLHAKKDFYYGFIDQNQNQIDLNKKDQIVMANNKLKQITSLVKDGRIADAYEKIMKFRLENKIDVLNSSSTLIYADILYKMEKKKYAVEGAKVLEQSLNDGTIIESDLLSSLILLVKLEIKVNKIKEAKFYANSILEIYEDPLSRAYGKMALASIDTHRRRYKKSIKALYEILVQTNSMEVATVVADDLYDVYVLNGEDQKAYELASKVLEKNIDFYANDSYLALKKVDKLIDANMPKLAIKILTTLLERAKTQENRNNFKYILANSYMKIQSKTLQYAEEAKELYKDLISTRDANPYKADAKMYVDEILMREGKLTPRLIIKKYRHDDEMQDKAMLQELLNYAKAYDYASINKFKKIYKKIKTSTYNRFGYENYKDLMSEINTQMIKHYLDTNNCKELAIEVQKIDQFSLKQLMQDYNQSKELLNCMYENPNEQSFKVALKAYNDSKDGPTYLLLQNIAMQLHLYDDAYGLSQKIDSFGTDVIKSQEFLNRFFIYGYLNNKFTMEKFFFYANENPQFVMDNDNKPRIIDFYYQYYLYLLQNNKQRSANEILHKLYNKQKKMDAFVYSPYVEMQLASESILDDDYIKALNYYFEALENPRRIKPNDLVKIYFEMSKIYKKQEKQNRYLDMIEKCKNVKDADNMYKDMCSKL